MNEYSATQEQRIDFRLQQIDRRWPMAIMDQTDTKILQEILLEINLASLLLLHHLLLLISPDQQGQRIDTSLYLLMML